MSPPPTTRPTPPTDGPRLDEVGALRALTRAVQNRIVSGLILALPVVLTFWIIYWLYATLKQIVLDPAILAVRFALRRAGLIGINGIDDRFWFNYVSPVIAVLLVLSVLYCLGLFVRSRFHRAVDWVLLHVPVVTTIYKALSNVFQSLDSQLHSSRLQRVVLVEFPHPGARSLAFVTNTLRDESTGRAVLAVCVLTGVMPPAGFTLFVAEDRVVDVDWTVNQTLQAILSGGITTPPTLSRFDPPGSSDGPLTGGPGAGVAPAGAPSAGAG